MTKIRMTEMAPSPRTSVGWAVLIFCRVLFQASALPAVIVEPAVFIPQWIPQAQFATVNVFLRDDVDPASAALYNEYHLIVNAGLNPEGLTVVPFSKQGLNFPEDGRYCLEKTFVKKPERVCRFARASLEGWQYAFDHPEEALAIVMKYAQAAHTGTNRPLQRWMLKKMRELLVPPGDGRSPGALADSDYERVGRTMPNQGVISAIPPLADFRRHCRSHGE